MKLYLSSFTVNALNEYVRIFPGEKLNILLSYGLRNGHFPGLFRSEYVNSKIIDSGTYTMNSKADEKLKRKISFGGYLRFLKHANCFYAFAYDADFNEEGWLNNVKCFDKARELKLELVPVIHSYEKYEIDEYLERGCQIIALGKSKYKKEEYISECANYIWQNGSKVHLLGGTDYNILAENPISFCDSSSWVQYVNYGEVLYWHQNMKKIFKFADLKESVKNSQEEIYQFNSYLERETKKQLCYDDLIFKNSIYRQVVNIRFFVNLQNMITQHHYRENVFGSFKE